MKWVFFIVTLCFWCMSFAESSIVVDEEEQAIIQRARKRLYPGGQDEQDLEVQAILTKPKRKKSYLDAETDEDAGQIEGM